VEGEVELEDNTVIVLTRIHGRDRLTCRADQREAAERAHAHHARSCPVARSLAPAIAITTELQSEEIEE
jgi:uncharacterized OsmC-like protein